MDGVLLKEEEVLELGMLTRRVYYLFDFEYLVWNMWYIWFMLFRIFCILWISVFIQVQYYDYDV